MRRWTGALILTAFVGVFLGTTLVNAWQIHFTAFIAVLIITGFASLSIGGILKNIHQPERSYPFFSKGAMIDFFAVFTGGILTYTIAVYGGVNVVLASGLIGALSALLLKPYAVAIFCGSFIGMSSPDLLGLPFILVAAMAAGLIFVLAKDAYNGVGGKLGTIALTGVFVTCLATSQSFLGGNAIQGWLIIGIILFAMAGALLSHVLNLRLSQGAVMGSAIVGVIAGGFLPLVFEQNGLTLAIVAFGASFAGMASRAYLKNEAWSILSGFIFALLFIFSVQNFGGVGGKLGTIAFASVLSVKSLSGFIRMHFQKVLQLR